MRYAKGDRVRHPTMAAWGIGLVLEDSHDDKARIFFEEAGEKTVSLSHVVPEIVMGPAAESLVLDNLKIDKGAVSVRYRSLKASMDYFLKEFPGGFEGERYRFHERDDKEEIGGAVQEQLARGSYNDLLRAEDFSEICSRALKLTGVRANAMIFKNEKMALRDGLKSDSAQRQFALSLYDVLHKEADFDTSFDAFATCLTSMGAGKWTIATYYPFFMHPDRHMFVKPTITQNAADVCAFDINYRSEISARTYRSVLNFSQHLKQGIARLEPRDMIDVQSFMWCIAPGTYTSADR